MLNNNPAIGYQFTKSEPGLKFCDSNSLTRGLFNNSHYTDISWHEFCSKITNNQKIFFDNISQISEIQIPDSENIGKTKSSFSSQIDKSVFHSKEKTKFSIKTFHQKLRSDNSKVKNTKISALKLKSLISKENMNFLPADVQQNLIQLMPECDKIINKHANFENKLFSLSKTSLNNEFFNKALSNYFFKITKRKSRITVDSFIDNMKSLSKHSTSNLLSNITSNNCTYSESENEDSPNIFNEAMITIKLDCDFNTGIEKLSKVDIESSNPFLNYQVNCDDKCQVNNETKQKCILSHFTKSLKFDSEPNEDISDELKDEESTLDLFDQRNLLSPFNSKIIELSKCKKYKRKLSGSANAPAPNKRPTRSTAGQLPARLKSNSPPPPIQNTNIQLSHLSLINKSASIRGKYKEKRKSKSSEFYRNSVNVKVAKTNAINCDSILYNLRDKLSKRLQRNCEKYLNDTFSADESIINASPDIIYYNSKSPGSLSPGSDKLSFVNSPSSKTSQNHYRQTKLKNSFYENQPPNSPQWSFSSEFTSQSSVESVLSQKNIKFEQEDINGIDNLLEEMDSEEMPPPRRTLTVAAMREKMRAKKMAKEEKRKDIDRDHLSDLDNISVNKMTDFTCKHSSTMSTMMSMPRENPSDETDDENMSNEFDTFLIDDNEIDDYHVEIDDKILNYSDDLDELLLTSGNESLLEIIMKDPDAMEIDTDNFTSLNSEIQLPNCISSQSSTSKTTTLSISGVNAFNSSNCIITTSKEIDKFSISDSSGINVDNPILLSQTLTSVIQKVSNNIQSSKEVSNIKGTLPNAYLVDGNGLSDALKLIQSLNPGAKVTTQQFYLVNSGPQLILCQTPPTQASHTCPVNSKSPMKSVFNTTQIVSSTSIVTPLHRSTTASFSNNNSNNNSINNNSNISLNQKVSKSPVITNSKSSTSLNQNAMMSSTISLLPQFSPFNSKSQNLYSVNSNFPNKIISPITNLGCKLNHNSSCTTSPSPTPPSSLLQSSMCGSQKSVTTNGNSNTVGIRLQLAQNFQHSHPVSIIQSSQNSMIPTIMNQQLQFLSPQSNNNISLITQSQPMSKLVLLYPNLNCQSVGTDINNSLKTDPQQLIFLSPQKEQSTPISIATNPTFQVLNGANFWQQINPNFGTILGSNNTNNLVLMNPPAMNNQTFSFNYQPQSQIIAANNLVIMSSNNFNQSGQISNNSKPNNNFNNNNVSNNNHDSVVLNSSTATSLTISVNNKYDEESLNNNKTQPVSLNLNSNSSQNSSVELLSNSSSSVNSKLSFDEKSACQFNKAFSETLTDSDQEKSINSPQFQLLTSDLSTSVGNIESNSFLSLQLDKCKHLTVDIDSLSPSNSVYNSKISNRPIEKSLSTSSQNDDSNIILSPGTDYDQSDFEIPCVYSSKLQINQNPINTNANNIIEKTSDNYNS